MRVSPKKRLVFAVAAIVTVAIAGTIVQNMWPNPISNPLHDEFKKAIQNKDVGRVVGLGGKLFPLGGSADAVTELLSLADEQRRDGQGVSYTFNLGHTAAPQEFDELFMVTVEPDGGTIVFVGLTTAAN